VDQPGVLSDRMIAAMIERGRISADSTIAPEQVQPASLDLRLGATAYRVRASFLPGRGRTVAQRLPDFTMHRIDLSRGAVLEKGCVYVVPLLERLRLPADMTAAASAKSSIGRLDLLCRVITDQGEEFDRVPRGYEGPLYVEICPGSFSVVVSPGQLLTQIILRIGDTVLDDSDLQALHARDPIVDGTPVISGGLGFSVDLRPGAGGSGGTGSGSGGGGALVGYRAKPHAGVIDLSKIGAYAAADFWEELRTDAGWIILDPGAFYILVSREAISIPPTHAAEMAPYLAMAGEFRVHYAGFFDPGFGHRGAGGSGSRGVLEVRCHEAPFVLEHGQVVGRLVYERMAEPPARLYGAALNSSYQGQGLRLSKHFRR